MDRPQPTLIGIVGGIASGKSYIAEQFERKGAVVVSADRLAHEVLRFEDVKQQVRQRWGEKVFGADGQIDRQCVAKIVFAPPPEGPRELKYLEQLTHPKIGELARQRLLELAAEPATKAIVLDVPLMYESGWNKFCDKIIFIDAPRSLRLARATARGWTEADFARREAAQESLETKRERADAILDNSETGESVPVQIDRLWQLLVVPKTLH